MKSPPQTNSLCFYDLIAQATSHAVYHQKQKELINLMQISITKEEENQMFRNSMIYFT